MMQKEGWTSIGYAGKALLWLEQGFTLEKIQNCPVAFRMKDDLFIRLQLLLQYTDLSSIPGWFQM